MSTFRALLTGRRAAHSLSSLLVQLCTQVDHSCEFSLPHSRHDRGLQWPSNDGLAQRLKDMLEDPKQGLVYIVVDTLLVAECFNRGIPSPREQVLKIVKELIDLL